MSFLFLTSITISSFFSPAWLTTRPEYFIVLIWLIFNLNKINKTISILKIELLLLFMLTIGAGISLLGQTFSGTILAGTDLMILWRYMYYISLLIFGGLLSQKLRANFFTRTFFYLLATSIILTSIFQYYNFLGINKFLVPIYTSSGAANSLMHGEFWRRVTGTYGNPNYWGLAMGTISVISFYFIYFKKRILGLPFLLLSFISIIFTGSRAALISTLLSIFLSTFFILHQEKKLHNAIVFCFTAAASGLILYFIFTNFIEYENKGRFDTSNVATLDSRIAYWLQILDSIQKSTIRIFIGYGSAKAVSIQYGDNMYIRMIRDYGIIGLFTYLSFLYTITKNIIFLSKQKITEARLMLYFIVMYLIFDLTADCWFEVRIICLFLISYSYIKAKYYNILPPHKIHV